MVYTILKKTRTRLIQSNPEEHVSRGDFVWKTLREAREWRDIHEKNNGIFAVLADWDRDTSVVEGKGYRVVGEPFKLLDLESVIPEWLIRICSETVETAWKEGLLEEGYINPAYATPEQESMFYAKRKDDILFQLRCMMALKLYEELEHRGCFLQWGDTP
jgi:hypothetical protein